MNMQVRFGAVIPAAGLSERMGAFKPLMPFGDSTVIESAVASVLPYVSSVVVIVGNRSDEVAAVLRERFGRRVSIVRNPDYRSSDMLRSVQLGLRAMGACEAFFLLPGDMPAVPDEAFGLLTAALDPDTEVLYPVCGGRRGHPPLIRSSLIPDIIAYRGDGGLRAVLAGRIERQVDVPSGGILADLDTPEDYEKLQSSQSAAPDGV